MKHLFYPFAVVLLAFSCSNDNQDTNIESNTPQELIDYQSLGNSISDIAQSTLLSNVSENMKKGGPVHTIEYCNLNASRLIDSISSANNTSISRISRKNRNKNNTASDFEKGILEFLETSNSMDTVIHTENEVLYYKSIRLGMPACLKCHGKPETDINPETLTVLKDKYPSDLAINYSMGDFRGAWKIVFQK